MADTEVPPLMILYTNYKGVISVRRIVPTGAPYYGSTEWHPKPQWLLPAFDTDKGEARTFSMTSMTILPTEAPDEDVPQACPQSV